MSLSRRSFCAAAALSPALLTPACAAPDEDQRERRERADALIRWVAGRYAVAGSGGVLASPQPARGVPDPQKYVWPKVLARLTLDPADTWSLAALDQFWKAGGDPAPHEASFYHFAAYGLARILFTFPAQVRPFRDGILAEAMRQEQLFSGQGTENHIAMWRTSGYLFAQEAGDARRLAQMREWIAGYKRRLLAHGQGEWDSSTYAAFDIASWLNLLQFAHDPAVRADARAVVDRFARSLALKWAFGALAGAEKRGMSLGSADAITAYVAWLWFGDTTEKVTDDFFTQSAIYAITPALALPVYRPSDETVALARKSDWQKTETYVVAKPNYAMTRPAEEVEVFRADARHAVGALVVSPIGGWGGGDTQETLWKCAVRGPGGGAHDAAVAVIAGAGAGYAARSKYNGEGRSPWDQVAMHENLLVQMTRVPEDADALTAQAKALFDDWKRTGKADKVSWADPVAEPWAYVTLPDAPGVVAVAEKGGVIFVAVPGAGAALFYAALTPLAPGYEWLDAKATGAKNRRAARTTGGRRGEVVGWAYEWGDERSGGFADFQRAVLSRPDRVTREDPVTVRLTDRTGKTTLRVRFGTAGTYAEPEYDWGPQPAWPSGEGHGRIPQIWADGKEVDHRAKALAGRVLYDGPRLRVHSTALTAVAVPAYTGAGGRGFPMSDQKPSLGYQDTPVLPSGYHVHDGERPQPPVVDPGVTGTPSAAGTPPSDAVVLIDGTGTLAKWQHGDGKDAGWKVENGYAEVVGGTGDIKTREGLGDGHYHVEFATPAEVKGNGQGRGNSGVFVLDRYEFQVLDNYENPTYPDGTVGAVYGQFPPLANASRKPGEWQTYDILFTGPRFNADGTVQTPAYATVLLNGVVVQHHTELLGGTTHKQLADYKAHPEAAPLRLQDHGNPVRFRNVWYRPFGVRDGGAGK